MLERLRGTARDWTDPDWPARAASVEQALGHVRFSEAQIAFALNEQMAALASLASLSSLDVRSLGGRLYRVESAEGQPLAGLPEAVTVLAGGGRVQLAEAGGLVDAYLREAGVEATPGAPAATLVRAESIDERLRVLPWRFGVAVLDGKENEAAREALAEDVLLYDGETPRCVRVVWAPHGLSPDPYMEAFAAFRGRFPAPEAHTSRVRMATAFAQKAGLPLTYLDDHSLLITRGDAVVQRSGHVRWVEYDGIEEVARWLSGEEQVGPVVARRGLKPVPAVQSLGTAHRPGTQRFNDAAREVLAALAL